MPYILVQGEIATSSPDIPRPVFVSGLKSEDRVQLKRFESPTQAKFLSYETHTVAYNQPACVILTALEVLGYKVVTCVCMTAEKYMWTMHKEFTEPNPDCSK